MPQYNPTVVYTQPTTVVVQETSSSADAAVAGLIGFTAGIAIGAAIDNNYYYGPYGWHGGGYMYNDAWDDYYDHREDAREDWQDHREDLVENRSDRAKNGPGKPHRAAGTAQETAHRADGSATGDRAAERDRTDRQRQPRPRERARRMSPAVTARPRPHAADDDPGPQRHKLGRVLRLLERQVGARGEQPRARAAEAARVREAAAGGGDDGLRAPL